MVKMLILHKTCYFNSLFPDRKFDKFFADRILQISEKTWPTVHRAIPNVFAVGVIEPWSLK